MTRDRPPDSPTPALTPSRHLALKVLAALHPEPARYSNETRPERGHIYWQASHWLEENGYAERIGISGGQGVTLTVAGVELAREYGLLEGATPRPPHEPRRSRA